ncbi:hypothetical protein CANCADRAFT_2806 [Tortispora caseinolytica NRRL Y-17796]|uniref:Nuclear transport factor 2 n=1 Tax=Tortispora caseinolytica NRRL Y-17796 TaxID=767744 RepID=A0A1E4TH79_9ASCO|nr:hypothetical protein CANCADRAFT_2806 [Tortispora caseinolytica NRRL Y-17796]
MSETVEPFIKSYYETLDKNRSNISVQFADDAHIVWNGNPLSGGVTLAQMYGTMPETRHELGSMDIHVHANSVIASVAGKVRVGSGRSSNLFGFHESLIIQNLNGLKFTSSTYRYIYKPRETAVLFG